LIAKLLEHAAGQNLGSWFLGWSSGDEAFHFGVTHQAGTASAASIGTAQGTAPLNSMVHVAATFDGTNLSLYVNGALEATDVFSWTGVYYGDEDVLIGAANFSSGYLRRFDGIIDEMRLWDHARSVGDITANMNCRLNGNETGLLAYWSFETGGLTDDSGNGHDGVAEDTGGNVNFVAPLVSVKGCQ
jgi:hypothetical protein